MKKNHFVATSISLPYYIYEMKIKVFLHPYHIYYNMTNELVFFGEIGGL
jgi:hypothetical protein